jgi:hypothetical protein
MEEECALGALARCDGLIKNLGGDVEARAHVPNEALQPILVGNDLIRLALVRQNARAIAEYIVD